MEQDGGRIHSMLGNGSGAAEWQGRAQRRRQLIDRYLWDSAAGLYFDYNVATRTRRRFAFATTFYPRCAGISSRHAARRVVAIVPRFESPGGILTSRKA